MESGVHQAASSLKGEGDMRQQIKFGTGSRSLERCFFTEAHFLKFAAPRNPDNLTHLVRATPNVFRDKTSSDVTTTIQHNAGLAKRASA
jgi:hypothetical protein